LIHLPIQQRQFIDAQGWKSNPDGTISFVANAADADPDALFIASTCQPAQKKTSGLPKKQLLSTSLSHTP